MAADITLLVPEFTQQIRQLLDRCSLRGIEMRPYMGLRDPFEQARLWRQSRSREEIRVRIASLQAQGAAFLAHCLESVGPQHGRPVTNALPGLSWHQWGEAVDCFWLVDGKAEWSAGKLVGGTDPREQTEAVLKRIDRVLASAGAAGCWVAKLNAVAATPEAAEVAQDVIRGGSCHNVAPPFTVVVGRLPWRGVVGQLLLVRVGRHYAG